jgi:electron transfer flavoprotein beta subunit
LASAIRKLGSFDLILCGKQASDGDTAQVGPGISMHLDIPQITYVKKIEELKNGVMRVERMVEEGFEIIEVPLPVLLTVVKEINEPRLPSLKGMMRAKNVKITVWTQKELNLNPQGIGLHGSPTQVIKIFTPPPRSGGQILKGDTQEVVEKLAELLRGEV